MWDHKWFGEFERRHKGRRKCFQELTAVNTLCNMYSVYWRRSLPNYQWPERGRRYHAWARVRALLSSSTPSPPAILMPVRGLMPSVPHSHTPLSPPQNHLQFPKHLLAVSPWKWVSPKAAPSIHLPRLLKSISCSGAARLVHSGWDLKAPPEAISWASPFTEAFYCMDAHQIASRKVKATC